MQDITHHADPLSDCYDDQDWGAQNAYDWKGDASSGGNALESQDECYYFHVIDYEAFQLSFNND